MGEINAKFGPSVVPIQLPIIEGGVFKGYVDVVHMTGKLFDGKGEKEVAIPSSMESQAQSYYEKLTEAAAEADEELMEKYLETFELSREEMLKGLSVGVQTGVVTPVACVSAAQNIGVSTLLDNVVYYLPSADLAKAPVATSVKTGSEVVVSQNGKFAAQVVKTTFDQFGKYSIVKIYRGALDVSVTPYNTSAEKAEKPTVPAIMRGKKTYPAEKLYAGDIGVLPKLQYTATGDTLCDAGDQIIFAPIDFPKPAISLAVTAKKQGEDDKVISGLNRIKEEDPTIQIEKNAETGDVLIQGLGEMHIEVVCGKLRNKSNVEAQLSDPRIPYRETIHTMAEAEGKHKKQSGGSGQYGVVQMRFEPADEGVDYEFVNAIVGGVVPKEFIPAVEKGSRKRLCTACSRATRWSTSRRRFTTASITLSIPRKSRSNPPHVCPTRRPAQRRTRPSSSQSTATKSSFRTITSARSAEISLPAAAACWV